MCMSGKKTKTLSTFYVSRVLVCRHDFGVHDHTHIHTFHKLQMCQPIAFVPNATIYIRHKL